MPAPVERDFTVHLDILAKIKPFGLVQGEATWVYCTRLSDFDPTISAPEFAAMELRLVDALVRNEAALDRWLMDEAMLTAAYTPDGKLEVGPSHEQVLLALAANLSPSDRAFCERVLAADSAYACAGPLLCATDAHVTSASAVRVPALAQPARPDEALAERRYRVTLNAHATLAPISLHFVDETLEQLGAEVAGQRLFPRVTMSRDEYAALQERLRDALIRDEAALTDWLRCDVLRAVSESGAEPFVESDEDAAVKMAVATMAPGDRAFFEQAVEHEILYECAADLFEGSDAEIEAAEFA